VGLTGLQFLNAATWRKNVILAGQQGGWVRRRLGEPARHHVAGTGYLRGLPGDAAKRRRLLARYGTRYDKGSATWLGGERLAQPGRTLAVGDTTGRRCGACPWQGHPVVMVHAGLRLNDRNKKELEMSHDERLL
jgi:hypothetical protein